MCKNIRYTELTLPVVMAGSHSPRSIASKRFSIVTVINVS